MTVQELMNKRANLWNQAKTHLDNAKRDANGFLSAEDAATYDKMEKDLQNYDEEIKRLKAAEERERNLSQNTSNPLVGSPAGTENKTGRASKEYSESFWNMMRNKGVSNVLQIGTGAEGGYLVPDEFDRTLVDALTEESTMRKYANVIRTSHGEHAIPVVASKGEAAWMDEGGLIPESTHTFDQVILGAHKLGTIVKVSDELLNDSAFDVQGYISKENARKFSYKEDQAFFIGDGNKKPLGILADEGGAEIGASVTGVKITFDNVYDLIYSVRKPYRKNSNFFLADETVKEIRKLKDNNNNYIWQPSTREGEPDKIAGYAYDTSEFMPKLSEGGKIMTFGDYKYYWIADRQSRTFKRLNELYAANGQVGFVSTQRVDGKLILREAVKSLKVTTA